MAAGLILTLAGAALFSLAALAGSELGDDDGWTRIAPLFEVPPVYRGDYGRYGSALTFQDGRLVRSPAEWRKRRAEIRQDWMRELGPWPREIANPQFKVLSEEHTETFTRKKIELGVAPSRTTIGYLLVPDGRGP